MGNYELLKAAINEVIKANGRQEITGEVLNQVLLSMVNSLGAGYQCMGVATPSTNPGTPDQNVFYFATQAGTYTNFNAIVLQAGISVLIWDGDWASQTWFTVDSTPTNNSQNLIASGAVFNALKLDGGAYDVTAHNSGATFASLSALLNSENLNTLIPTEIRHGGMSIKFVQSSDNKYVQYRYMGTATTGSPNPFIDTANWQGVDDGIHSGSQSLAKSGDVYRYVSDSCPKVEDSSDDFGISDISGNNIVKFSNGHLKTKSFDSSNINGGYIKEKSIGDAKLTNLHPIIKDEVGIFGIRDEANNAVFNITDGYPNTKNFNGKNIANKADNANQFAFGTEIEDLNDHHEIMAKIAGLTKKTPLSTDYNTGGNKPLVLLHFSDIHSSFFELDRVRKFKEAYSEYIDDVLSTGDNLYDNITDSFPWAENGGSSFLNTIGNHDAANGSGGIATELECYNKEFADFIANWGVVYTQGLCYYYKDYDDAKVRLIVLDCMHFNDTQKTWFANTLEAARTHQANNESDPYAVIVAVHYPVEDQRTATFVDCTFCSKMFKDAYFSYISSAASIVDTFQQNGGEFVCWLTGHTHKDYVTKPAGYPNQLVITIDSLNVYALESDTQRIMGTKSQDLFNLVAVNTTGKTVSLARIGAEYDVYMRHKGVFCWDYVNHQIIFNN